MSAALLSPMPAELTLTQATNLVEAGIVTSEQVERARTDEGLDLLAGEESAATLVRIHQVLLRRRGAACSPDSLHLMLRCRISSLNGHSVSTTVTASPSQSVGVPATLHETHVRSSMSAGASRPQVSDRGPGEVAAIDTRSPKVTVTIGGNTAAGSTVPPPPSGTAGSQVRDVGASLDLVDEDAQRSRRETTTGSCVWVKPETLSPHPVNGEIYDKRRDPEWEAGVVQAAKAGTLEPLVVNKKSVILGGERRWTALLGKVEQVQVRVFDVENEVLAVIRLNAYRDRSLIERLREARQLVAELSGPAAERMLAGVSTDGKAGGRGRRNPAPDLVEGFHEHEQAPGTTLDQVARAVGIKRESLRKFLYVFDSVAAPPELKVRLGKAEISVDAAYRDARRLEKIMAGDAAAECESDATNEGSRTGTNHGTADQQPATDTAGGGDTADAGASSAAKSSFDGAGRSHLAPGTPSHEWCIFMAATALDGLTKLESALPATAHGEDRSILRTVRHALSLVSKVCDRLGVKRVTDGPDVQTDEAHLQRSLDSLDAYLGPLPELSDVGVAMPSVSAAKA